MSLSSSRSLGITGLASRMRQTGGLLEKGILKTAALLEKGILKTAGSLDEDRYCRGVSQGIAGL